jgi:YHS domain-containing protein
MIPKLLIVVAIIYILYKVVRVVRRGFPAAGTNPGRVVSPAAGEDLVEDPVCHTYVPVSHACRASFDGRTLYFCSPKCLERYKAEKVKTA